MSAKGLSKEEGEERRPCNPRREGCGHSIARAYYGPVSGRISLRPADDVRDQRGLRGDRRHAASNRQQGLNARAPASFLVACCLLHLCHQTKNPVSPGIPRERDGTTLVPSASAEDTRIAVSGLPARTYLSFSPGAPGRVRGARGCRLPLSRLADCPCWPLLLPIDACISGLPMSLRWRLCSVNRVCPRGSVTVSV